MWLRMPAFVQSSISPVNIKGQMHTMWIHLLTVLSW